MTTKLQSSSLSVFDTSLSYSSYARNLRSCLFAKAIKVVDQWDMRQPTWKLSKEAKKLANEIFNEYSEELHKVFNQPDYSFWLSNSLNAEQHTFILDLLERIDSKMSTNS